MSSADSLDSIRVKLQVLKGVMDTLLADLARLEPLTPWPILSSHFTTLHLQLTTLSHALHTHSLPLLTTLPHPTSTFPAHTYETLLTTLLRKKLHPETQEWAIIGGEIGRDIREEKEGEGDWRNEVVSREKEKREWEGGWTWEETQTEGWWESSSTSQGVGVEHGLKMVEGEQGKFVRKRVKQKEGGEGGGLQSMELQPGLTLPQMFKYMSCGYRAV